MNLKKRIGMHQDDKSGTPIGLLELVRSSKSLVVVDELDESNVAVDFPFGPVPQRQTGCSRFVSLVKPIQKGRSKYKYALLRDPSIEVDLPQYDERLTNEEQALRQRIAREKSKK